MWVSAGLKEYFAVYAVDNAFLVVLRDILVNKEVKEAMKIFGVGIRSRDILLTGLSLVGDGSDRLERLRLS